MDHLNGKGVQRGTVEENAVLAHWRARGMEVGTSSDKGEKDLTMVMAIA